MLGDSVRRRTPAPRRPATRRPPPRQSILPAWGWRVWVPVLAALIVLPFAIGYLIATFVLFPPAPVGPGGITVPQLVGQTEGEASRQLAAAGLGTLVPSRLPHPEQPTGVITAQSPLAGQQLASGGTVRVAVSSGLPRAVVPDLVGFTEGRAAALLQRLGFTVQRAIEDSDSPLGRVVRSEPEPGQERALPASVTIFVSAGPPAAPPDTTEARWP